MSHSDNIPKYIDVGLTKQGPETLRAIARKAEELADEKAQEVEAELEANEVEDEPDDDPERDDAPKSATLTTKEIHGNSYYYWQWREGEKVKSEYIRPVDPKE